MDFAELPVANDALTVVVNQANDWMDCITMEQLAAIWAATEDDNVTVQG